MIIFTDLSTLDADDGFSMTMLDDNNSAGSTDQNKPYEYIMYVYHGNRTEKRSEPPGTIRHRSRTRGYVGNDWPGNVVDTARTAIQRVITVHARRWRAERAGTVRRWRFRTVAHLCACSTHTEMFFNFEFTFTVANTTTATCTCTSTTTTTIGKLITVYGKRVISRIVRAYENTGRVHVRNHPSDKQRRIPPRYLNRLGTIENIYRKNDQIEISARGARRLS